jgi:ligand-binding SRPBCC domain-containing protein
LLHWLISESTGTVSDGVGYHVFDREQVIDLPLADVFRFFSDAANLRLITPASLGFEFEEPPPKDMAVGAEIRYRIRVAGIPLRWVTRIREWDPPHRFADLQAEGPYAYWLHTHTFSEIAGGRTLMRDRVIYRVPFGIFGEVARRLFVERQLKRIFDHREQAVGPALRGDETAGEPGARPDRRRLAVLAGVVSGMALVVGLLGWRRARGR